MTRGVFITGTDTDCGKTHVATALIRALRERGLRVAGFKPVAAGADSHDGNLRNDDALALIEAATLDLPYERVNPYCFAPAVSPHLAAEEAATVIELAPIRHAFDRLAGQRDFVVVEGAGGWRVPLGPDLDGQDLALALGLPVILVVGLRLGCLNHALLSEQVILASGATLLGWVGNRIDPQMARQRQNLDTLAQRLGVPCLGILPHVAAGAVPGARSGLDIDALLQRHGAD